MRNNNNSFEIMIPDDEYEEIFPNKKHRKILQQLIDDGVRIDIAVFLLLSQKKENFSFETIISQLVFNLDGIMTHCFLPNQICFIKCKICDQPW